MRCHCRSRPACPAAETAHVEFEILFVNGPTNRFFSQVYFVLAKQELATEHGDRPTTVLLPVELRFLHAGLARCTVLSRRPTAESSEAHVFVLKRT